MIELGVSFKGVMVSIRGRWKRDIREEVGV